MSSNNQSWRNPSKITLPQYTNTSGNFSPRGTKHKKNKKALRKIIGFLIPLCIFLILVGGIAFVGLLAWVSKDLPSPDGIINRSVTVSTKIYDRSGKTALYDIHGNIKRTLITLNEIPDYAKKAVITAEDRNFYKGHGFSITGIVRSMLINVFTGKKYGGSTLTQQFVKNAILTNEKTYIRKLKELLISYQIEKKFNKDQILNLYFNEIPYGSVIYGIEAASQSFFGKPAKDLTLSESAILAAIPQMPTYYSPYGNHKDQLIVRQRYILDSMANLGYITKDQAEQAKKEKIVFRPLKESIMAPHFVMYIKELLSEEYGEEFINQEGLKVYTTLDLDKQKIAEDAVKAGVELNGKKYDFGNASLVALDPKTGQILAMVGSADYFNDAIDGQVNVALSPRQPGSSFKPIVYTAAFIKGYTPNTVVYDTITNFDTSGNQPYIPHNYNLKENGPVTFRKALAGSLNVPAVKATYLTGLNNILDLADKLGYTTLKNRDRFGLSLVLGGGEVKLLEHAGAYAALSQEGIHHGINPILKIEDKKGKVLYEYQDKSENVIDPEIARETTDILSDDSSRAFIFGAHSKLTLPGRPVAAKTGTTNDYHDAWTMGYTPGLVCGVWVGNSDNKAMKKGADGSIIAAPIWNQFMKESLENTPVESFAKPQNVLTGKPVLDGVANFGQTVKIDSVSGKLATEYTPSSTVKELILGGVHDILYYVNKDDPRGPQPQNPQDDPQFNNWEQSAAKWAQANGLITTSSIDNLPTDYDDVHLPGQQAQIKIAAPTANQTVSSANFEVKINHASPQGVQKIDYYVDKHLLLTQTGGGAVANLDFSDLDNGYHTLSVALTDTLGVIASDSIDFNLLLENNLPLLSWLSPTNGSTVKKFPLTIKFNLINWTRLTKIDLYYIGADKTEHFFNTVNLTGENLSIVWQKKPISGDYTLFANMFTAKGKKYRSDNLNLKIQ
ncbi:MAG: PBP1A family penicillin-binding protein [Patescibacteria group bacterium]